jgi:hypothetical protein
MTLEIVAVTILSIVVGTLMFTALLGTIFPKLGHKVFGWHTVNTVDSFDGASVHGTCTVCHKDCMQDSQGNWF